MPLSADDEARIRRATLDAQMTASSVPGCGCLTIIWILVSLAYPLLFLLFPVVIWLWVRCYGEIRRSGRPRDGRPPPGRGSEWHGRVGTDAGPSTSWG